MTTWKVTLEALQPISIAANVTADTTWDSTNFIPGSTWRGAIAEHWKYTVGFDHTLTEAFIEQSIFHDAYEVGTTYRPIYFRKEKKTGKEVNILETYLKENIFLANHNGNAVVEYWSTYEHDVIKSAAIGTTMSRTRESVQHGKLYTMTSIAEGTIFETTAQIPEEVVTQFAPSYEVTVYVGKKRFSGYGKTRIKFEKQSRSQYETAFNDLQQWSPSKDEVLVALSAISPVAIYDTFLRPAQQIEWTTHIVPLLESSLKNVTPLTETTWGTSVIRNGWQQQWNAPKPTEQVLNTGTTYIATFKKEDAEAVKAAIGTILTKGIGERIQEGFGQFVIAPTSPLKLSMTVEEVQEAKKTLYGNSKDDEFTTDEESGILKLAEQLTSQLSKAVSLSQWQMLLSESDVIHAITSTNEMAYIEKRIHNKSNVRNAWRNPSLQRQLKNGELLRRYVQQMIRDDVYKGREEKAVRLLLRFSARIQRMDREKKGVR